MTFCGGSVHGRCKLQGTFLWGRKSFSMYLLHNVSFYAFFWNTVISEDIVQVVEWLINSELQRIWKITAMAYSRCCWGFCMAKLRKPRKSQKRWDIPSTSLPLQLPDVFAVCESKDYTTEHVQTLFFLRIQVSQEKRSIFWEVIVSVILSEKLYMNMSPIPNGFRDRAIWL